MKLADRGYVLEPGEGAAYWFVGSRMTVKAGAAETNGSYAIIECEAPAGYEPPAHIHVDEDEIFVILEGALDIECAGQSTRLGAGGFLFLPRSVPHEFRVTPEAPARFLIFTSPGRFEQLVTAIGEVPDGPGFPPPSEPDFDRLIAAAAGYGIEFLLPEPA